MSNIFYPDKKEDKGKPSVCGYIVSYIEMNGEISGKDFKKAVLYFTSKLSSIPYSELNEKIPYPVIWALNVQRITGVERTDGSEIEDDIFDERNKISLVKRKGRQRTMEGGLPHDEDTEEYGIKEGFGVFTRNHSRQFYSLLNKEERWYV